MAGIKLKQFMGILLNGNENKLTKRIMFCYCQFPKIKDDTPFKQAFRKYIHETHRNDIDHKRWDGGVDYIYFHVNDFDGNYESENIADTLWLRFIFDKNPEIKIVHSGGSDTCTIVLMKNLKMPDISDAAEAILKQNPSKYGFNYRF